MAAIRADALLEEVGRRKRVGVEIGVFQGLMSQYLLGMDKGLTLYLVDPWCPIRDASYLATDDLHHKASEAQHEQAMQKALGRVRPFGERAQVLRMTSLEAARQFDEASLDFAFIDGDHSYAAVRNDIAAWWPKIQKRGLLSGHDYREERGYGVVQAVNEFVQEHDLPLRLGQNFTWFVTKP